MQDALTVTITVAALFFSVMCGLLLEEFIFGGLFRLLQPARRRSVSPRPQDDLFGDSEK